MTDANEQYVRERWASVQSKWGSLRPTEFMIMLPVVWNKNMTLRCFTSEAVGWQAAAEFTRARLEEVRQVEEEIAWVTRMMGPYSLDAKPSRILGRLQAILGDLKRGMKETAK